MLRQWHSSVVSISGCLILLTFVSGCSLVAQSAVPVDRIPEWMLEEPKALREPINLISLRADPPETYLLGPRDILGAFVEGVLGSSDSTPPIHFPNDGDMPPALGFPVPVREDGKLYLPLIGPVPVSGLTIAQAEEEVRRRYIDNQILSRDTAKIILTLIRKRTNQVLVVREDSAGGGAAGVVLVGPSKRGSVTTVDMPVDESDVMHALAKSGGLPGLDAKNEVVILRGKFADAQQRDNFLSEMRQVKEYAGPGLWIQPDSLVLRIPLRAEPGQARKEWKEDDIRLQTGDIIFIETREREVYYTGGLLQGREMPLPRDYDLDVLAAISLAGGSNATGLTGGRMGSGMGGMGMGGGGGGGGGGGIIPATQIIVVRKLENGKSVPIRINLNRAIVNDADRILIQPGDYVILQYTPAELVGNVLLSTFTFNYFINKIR
jgi:protein involved in polysaccharide export with SLBB domain